MKRQVHQSRKKPRPIPRKLREEITLCFEDPQKVMFLDLETTGLSHFYDEYTIVGWSIGGSSKTLIKGQNPEEFIADCEFSNALVTFNGIRFDQRFVHKEIPDAKLAKTHLDLMYMCRRVGLTGGQKAIEEEIGVDLRKSVMGVDGFAAVLLWHQYLRGDHQALKTLISYNRADIAAMGEILNYVLRALPLERNLSAKEVDFLEWSAPLGWESIPSIPPPEELKLGTSPSFMELFAGSLAEKAKIVGIDLTGSEARPSGFCVLDGTSASTSLIKSDKELLAHTLEAKPDLVSIDSPLCLPAGRISAFDDDPGRDTFGIMRQCERKLKRRGVNVYPSLLPSMQKLTARGIRLANEFRRKGIPVIESYPGAAQDIMRIPRKRAGIEFLQLGLEEFGITLVSERREISHDELDAVTAALVGTFHLAGLSEGLGSACEPPLIIPDLRGSNRPVIFGISGPIAAGKTTAGKFLENEGFAYTRFSLAIDEILEQRGSPKNRVTRQKIGAEIQMQNRQTELADRTLRRVWDSDKIVVDGLRSPEDHAFFFEAVGFRFIHIFIDAPAGLRHARYVERSGDAGQKIEEEFKDAQHAAVETGVKKLRRLAHTILYNDGTMAQLKEAIGAVVEQDSGDFRCLSQ